MPRWCALAVVIGLAIVPAGDGAGGVPAGDGITRAAGCGAGGDPRDAGTARFAYLRKLDSHLQNLAAERLDGGDLARHRAARGADARRRATPTSSSTSTSTATWTRRRPRCARAAWRSARSPTASRSGWSRATLPVSALTERRRAREHEGRARGPGPRAPTPARVLSQGDAAHRGPAGARARADRRRREGRHHLQLDQPRRRRRRRARRRGTSRARQLPAGQVQVLLDGTAGQQRRGPRDGRDRLRHGAGDHAHAVHHRRPRRRDARDGDRQPRRRGAKVIADDTFQITEPFFQDGVIAQAVDRAKAAGVTYLVSAGNRARQSWEGTYAAMTDPRGVSPSTNDFDPAPRADAVQTIGTFTNRTVFVALQWDEPFGQASTDLAIDVYRITGGRRRTRSPSTPTTSPPGSRRSSSSINVTGDASRSASRSAARRARATRS